MASGELLICLGLFFLALRPVLAFFVGGGVAGGDFVAPFLGDCPFSHSQ